MPLTLTRDHVSPRAVVCPTTTPFHCHFTTTVQTRHGGKYSSMMRSKPLDDVLTQDNGESQDSQAILEGLKAELGVGLVRTPPCWLIVATLQ